MASRAKLVPLAVRALRHAAAAQQAGSTPPAPPRSRAERALAFAAHRGFTLSVVISAALILGVLALNSDSVWLAWLRICLGIVLIVEGLLLATDWRGARRLTLWRMRRGEAPGAPVSFTHRLVRRLASLGLQLLGVAWLGAGILAATLGLPQLV